MSQSCTYTFKGPDGRKMTIEGASALKAYLATGGLEFLLGEARADLARRPEQVLASQGREGDWNRLPGTHATKAAAEATVKVKVNGAKGTKPNPAWREYEFRIGQGRDDQWYVDARKRPGAASMKLSDKIIYEGVTRSANRQIDTPEFKTWSGGNLVVLAADASKHQFETGKPVVVEGFHGTRRNFDRVDTAQASAGYFLTSKPVVADEYAGVYPEGMGGGSFPLGGNMQRQYVRMDNPLVVNARGASFNRVDTRAIPGYPLQMSNTDAINQWAKSRGYDGVIYKDLRDSLSRPDGRNAPPSNVYVTFKPSFVKSAIGNSGEYSLQDESFLASRDRVTETPEFKRWFGDSKVVDAEGKPLVVYHGSDEIFTVFDMERAEDGAHFFTADSRLAANFGDTRAFFVSLQNPMIIEQADLDAAWDREHPSGEQDDRNLLPRDFVPEFVRRAKAEGRDGLVVRGMQDVDSQADVFLPLRPEQIKSATDNRGTFDPDDPDIRRSEGRQELPRGYVGPVSEEEREQGLLVKRLEDESFEAWGAGREKVTADTVRWVTERMREAGIEDSVVKEASISAARSLSLGKIAPGGEYDPETHPYFSDYRAAAGRLQSARNALQQMISARLGPPEFEGMRQLADFDREQVRTPEFRRWFKDSKVVDDRGRPLIVFHGTNRDLSEFATVREAGAVRNNNWFGQLGSWFAAPQPGVEDYEPGSAESTAEGFSELRGDEGSVVYPVYLSIQNPYEVEGYESLTEERDDAGGAAAFRQMLVKQGYDGVVVRESDTDGGQIRDDWVAFYPTQIKSAIGNRGTFSLDDPDITRSSGRDVKPLSIEQDSREWAVDGEPTITLNKANFGGRSGLEWVDGDNENYVTSIAAYGDARGHEMLRWLKDHTGKPSFAVSAVDDAIGFYERMGEIGLMSGYTQDTVDSFFGIDFGDGEPQRYAGDVRFNRDDARRSAERFTDDQREELERAGRDAEDAIRSAPRDYNVDLTAQQEAEKPAKAWIEKVYAGLPRNPMMPRQRVMMFGEDDFAVLELDASGLNPGGVTINWIQAYPLRSGNGTKAIRELQRMAAEDGIELDLWPWDKGRVSQANLIKFYKSVGFEPIKRGSKNMIWRPGQMTKEELRRLEPMMDTPNSMEFRQRLQWLSEGMLRNNLYPAKGAYKISQDEIDLYRRFRNQPGSEGIRRSVERSPLGFYSALAKGIGDLPTKQAPGGAWKAAIKGLVNKGAAKADEVEWSGINDWLDLQQGKVTKQQVAEYLEQGGVQVEETVLGNRGGWTAEDSARLDELEDRRYDLTPEEETERSELIRRENAATRDGESTPQTLPKYGQYTLPGGENYREVLLTLPVSAKNAAGMAQADRIREEAAGLAKQAMAAWTERGDQAEFDRLNNQSRDLYRQAGEVEKAAGTETYKYESKHWDQPNVLAHIRLNDRTDADGNRVLFVEELQSDWGQEGKKRGFGANWEIKETPDGKFQILRNGQPVGGTHATQAIAERLLEQGRGNDNVIPTAPFVTKTEGWLNLALKRVMVMAAEGGYDKVAFVTGEQSAERFSLDKQIDSVSWRPAGADRATITISPKSGAAMIGIVDTNTGVFPRFESGVFGGEALESVLGKEIAERVLASPEGSLAGDGLKVEAKGMRAFYDTIVPTALKKLLPKVGGGQMGNVRLPRRLTSQEQDSFFEKNGYMPDEEPLTQPGFEVTDAMREKVADGLPLFSRDRAQTQTPEFKRWFGDSKVVDGQGRPLVVYHGTTGDFDVFRDDIEGRAGFYFTSDKAFANSFAEGRDANVMPVYLSITKPADLRRGVPGSVYDALEGQGYSRLVELYESDPQEIWNFFDGDTELSDALQRAGYDGMRLSEPTGRREVFSWVAFRPEQIKSAIGNSGAFDPSNPDIRRSAERSPLGFYSALAKGIEGLPTKQAPAGAWKAAIKGLVNKGAAKADEVEWSGINDWLDLQQGKVTKEQVAEYLRQGGVRVEETQMGGPRGLPAILSDYFENTTVRQPTTTEGWIAEAARQERKAQQFQAQGNDRLAKRFFELAEAMNEYAESGETGALATKYSKYTLPGGENYREVLLTLPEKQPDADAFFFDIIDEDGSTIEFGVTRASVPGVLRRFPGARAVAMSDNDPDDPSASPYKSNHWDQPNVLAHIRLNDRTDADGNRVLFVEELQSDWGQEGKKKGFRRTLSAAQQKRVGELNRVTEERDFTDAEQAEYDSLRDGFSNDAGLPAAPFVTKTEGWLNLALKRVMIMAAEGGYDKVAFVNGEQSADRYDLSKQVNYIQWNPSYSGGRLITLEDQGGKEIGISADPDGTVYDSSIDGAEGKKLDEVLGKELADKIMASDQGDLRGLELKVGGKGMKAFYDTIVPAALKKLLPKVGGGRIEAVNINSEFNVFQIDDGLWGNNIDGRTFPSEKAAREAAGMPQPGFDVTDAMREKVADGLPLFSRDRPGINVRSDGDNRYADLIVDGLKTVESRDSDSLRPYVGKTVGIVRTGEGRARLIGSAKVGEPTEVDAAEFRARESEHMVPEGSRFDIKPGSTKWLYPLTEAKRFDEDAPVDSRGIVSRRVRFSRDRASWTKDRIDSLLSAHAYTMDDGRSKAYAGFVSPEDFLRATTPADSVESLEAEKRPLDEKELAGEVQPIFLKGEPRGDGTWKTTGHEGRHRMMALRDAGVRRVPVVFDVGYGLTREPLQGLYVTPQRWSGAGQAQGGFFVDSLIPISYKHASELRDTFAGDSDIRFSRRRNIDTPEFRKWFGNSKVVNGLGQPRVVYHGTAADVAIFDMGRAGQTYGLKDEKAFFFTGRIPTAQSAADDATGLPAYASKYAYQGFGGGDQGDYGDNYSDEPYDISADYNGGQNLMPVYLSLQNPLIVDAPYGQGAGTAFENGREAPGQLIERAKREGYDGIIIRGKYRNFDRMARIQANAWTSEADKKKYLDGLAREDARKHQTDHYFIAFRSDQIKSAIGNVGAYGQRPITEEEANRFGMGAMEADFRQYEGDIRFSVDRDYRPEKTVKAYKLFRMDERRPGELFPLFVDADKPVPMGEWLSAQAGPAAAGGKVKSKLGPLAYRPGWHAGDLPVAAHIGMKKSASDAKPGLRNPEHVWAEVEMAADVDWQAEANKRGTNKDGKVVPVKAHITDEIPRRGFYRYKTNPNMTGNWLIGGEMRVLRLLSDSEVQRINRDAGVADLPRKEPLDLNRFGFESEITKSADRDDRATSAWQSPSASKFDDWVYKLQDKQIDTKRVVDEIKDVAGALADDMDVYLQEELFHGRAAKRTEDFVNKELRPLVDSMAKDGLKIEDLDTFLHARHAREANAVIAQRNPEIQDGGSGMTNQDAADYFANLDEAQRRKLEAAAAKVDAILAETRKMMVDYQLESPDVIKGWGQMFQHYVPLMREDEGAGAGAGIGQGFSIKGREVKSRTGSTRKVVDIFANIAMQRERTIVRGEKNRVSQALHGLAAASPNKEFWTVDKVPTKPTFNPATGLVEDRPDTLFKMRDNVIVSKVLEQDDEGRTVAREKAVIFNEKNERAVRMATALKNLDAAQLEGLMGASAAVTRYFASINTQYNPVFGIINLMRDVQGAIVNLNTTELKDDKLRVARGTMSALMGIMADARKARRGEAGASEWSALWEDFQSVGGQTGYRQLFQTSADRAKDIQRALNPDAWMDSRWGRIFTAGGTLKVPLSVAMKGARWLFDLLSDYNLAMENGIRLSAYKVALDKGMSRERAASLAKNLTVNFNRKGQVGQQAGALYAFFNAAMQGTARLGQTLFEMEPGKPKTIRLSSLGKKIVYGGMLLGTTQALALAAAGFSDDDPPDFVRERSLIIPTGGKTYISIPMPLGLHVIPNVGRVTTEWALSGFKNTPQRVASLLGTFADSFNPIGNAGWSMQTLAPTALDPLVALTENKDWQGRPIAKESMNRDMPGPQLYRDTATSWGRLISESINYLSGGDKYSRGVLSPTPDQIDYLIGQLTGGVGREISKVEQTAFGLVRGEEVPTYKIPLVGRLIGDSGSQASEGTAFYANAQKLNKLETEIKLLREDGKTAEAQALRASRPEAYLMTQANYAERAIQRLRKEKSELIKDGAPREKIREIEERITARMAGLNRAMEALEAAR